MSNTLPGLARRLRSRQHTSQGAPLLITLLALVAVTGCGGSTGGGHDATASQVAVAKTRPGPFSSLMINASMTPSKAGTTAQPRGVKLGLGLQLGRPRAADPPLLRTATIEFPRGSTYDGGAYPSCAQDALDRHGPDGCPAGSVMGSGSALAFADRARSPARITVVNGGKDRLFFWTEMDHPARVQAAVVGTITARPGGGYRLSLAFPRELQVVAGVPIALRNLHVTMGRAKWLATTSCPASGDWPISGAASFNDGKTATAATGVRCSR